MPGGRVDTRLDWSFESLKLFKNGNIYLIILWIKINFLESRNKMTFNSYEPKLIFAKGYVESSLSRSMVEFMLNELNLTELMKRIEQKNFGIDELLIPTLHASDAISIPGGFTHECINKNIRVTHITR